VLEHVTRGLANTPAAYCELMSGKTGGKALVEVDAELHHGSGRQI
jgi:NADPH-dependent curcumin reductase CurA